jgi:hypothetical protein
VLNGPVASWRGDVQNSGALGGAVTAVIGVAAVVVAVVALGNSQRHDALLAIGIAAVVVFILAAIVFIVKTRRGNRQAIRYLREEQSIIADMKAALEDVQEDLEALPERGGLLKDHMDIVNGLTARITATKGINELALRVASEIYGEPFRPDEPEASKTTVIVALLKCEKADVGYRHIENELNSITGWRRYVSKPARRQPTP